MKSLELVQRLGRLVLLALLLLLLHATAQPVDIKPSQGTATKASLSPIAVATASASTTPNAESTSSAQSSSSSSSPLLDSAPAKVIYDQRQSGKYNIRISIKDVAIIEMDHNGFGDGSFSDEDYYYDDADLTVKPITLSPTSTTAKPTNTTTAAASEASTTAPIQATHTATSWAEQHEQPSAAAPATSTAQNIYSANLLADIDTAQQQQQQHLANISSTPTPAMLPPPRRTTNVVILPTTHAPSDPQSLYSPSTMSEGRTKHIPVHLVPPMLMQSRQHASAAAAAATPFQTVASSASLQQQQLLLQLAQLSAQQDQTDESRVYNFKMQQRANKPPTAGVATGSRHCRHNQYRDNAGHCRTKRSTSFLRKLFSMFAAFPFVRVDGAEREDD